MHRLPYCMLIFGLVATSANAAQGDDPRPPEDPDPSADARIEGRPWWAEPAFPLEVRKPRKAHRDVDGDWERDDAPSLPEPLLVRMLHCREALRADSSDYGSTPPIVSELFHVPGPRSTRLWCHSYEFPDSPPTWDLMLEDPRTGEFSPDPLVIRPTHFFRFDPCFVDLDGDGVEELVTENYFHNGTVLNFYPRAWWRIQEDLTFHRVFAMGAIDDSILVDHVWGSAVRRLVRSATGDLQVEVWRDPPKYDDRPRLLGRLLLEHDAGEDRWHATNRHVLFPQEPWASQVNLFGCHHPAWGGPPRLDETGSD